MPVAAGCAELGARLLSPRQRLPAPAAVDAEKYFSAEEIARGARFARPQLALALAREVIQVGVLAILTAKWRPTRTKAKRRDPARDAWQGALTAAATGTCLSLARVPIAAIARRRAIAVGLDTQSWSGWAADAGKAFAIGGVMTSAAGAAVTPLISRYPRGWWLPAAGGSVLVSGLFGALAPVVLAPLFNDFTPLPDGETRSDVLELAQAAGIKVKEVYSVDASRRTQGANAYVTGIGPTRRVVLFDTLLDRYSRDQVRVVVAHELSHVRHRDALRFVGLSAIVAPAMALAAQRVSWLLSGVKAGPPTLPALALSVSLVSAPLGILGSRLSRAIERRADADALEFSRSPQAFISMQQSLVRQNVADITPPRWVRLLLASHPPSLERIGAAVAYAATQ